MMCGKQIVAKVWCIQVTCRWENCANVFECAELTDSILNGRRHLAMSIVFGTVKFAVARYKMVSKLIEKVSHKVHLVCHHLLLQ